MKALYLIGLAALGLVGVTGTPNTADVHDPECPFNDAIAWVGSNADELPTTLQAVDEFDMYHRRAILSASPLEVRVELWRENIEAVLHRYPALTPEQITFLRELQGDLEDLHSMPRNNDALTDVETAARTILGDEIASDAVAVLGTPVLIENSLFFDDCTCSVASDWCLGIGIDCIHGGCSYPANQYSCGTLGLYLCDGTCGIAPTD